MAEVITLCDCGQLPGDARCTYDATCTLHPGDYTHGYQPCPECGKSGACDLGCTYKPPAVIYRVDTATGVSRPAFSPSGQLWEWTPQCTADYSNLADAIAAADAIAPADGLMVTLCRYPAPDRQTAPCMAQRIGHRPWRGHDREFANLAELLAE